VLCVCVYSHEGKYNSVVVSYIDENRLPSTLCRMDRQCAAFKDVFSVCCGVPAFIEVLTEQHTKRGYKERSLPWNLEVFAILLKVPSLCVRASTRVMMESLFQQDALRFLQSLCLQPICVGKSVCRLVQHWVDSAHDMHSADYLSCFIYYLCKRVAERTRSTWQYHRILVYNVRKIAMVSTNQPAHALRIFNASGTEFLLRTTGVHAHTTTLGHYELIPRKHNAQTLNLHKICHYVMGREKGLRIASVNSDLLDLLNSHAKCPTYIITRRVFQSFHTYIMTKSPSQMQLSDICTVYLNLAFRIGAEADIRQQTSRGKRLCYIIVTAFVQFRARHGGFDGKHFNGAEPRFDLTMLLLLKGAIYESKDKIVHIQSLLQHLTLPAFVSPTNREVREICVRILRHCIIAEANAPTSYFHRTMSILSKLPPASANDDYVFHHILYSTVHRHIVMHQSKAQACAHSQHIVPLLFTITECVERQHCDCGKRIKRLLSSTRTFIGCLLYLWGRSTYIAASASDQHIMLCFMVMSVNNICLHEQAKSRFNPGKFVRIFHHILLCLSDQRCMHLWQKNEHRVMMRFIFIYIGFYSSTAHEFSTIDAEMIQRIVCNSRLSYALPTSSHIQNLHFLNFLSTRAYLQGFALKYLKKVVVTHSTEHSIGEFVLVVISNQMQFVCKNAGTVVMDKMMPEIVCIFQSLSHWTPSQNIEQSRSRLGSHVHVCVQMCKFYVRIQHVHSHDKTTLVALIDDMVVGLLFNVATNFDAIGRDTVFHVTGLLVSWQIFPGRKQSVTWLHWTFSFLFQVLNMDEFRHHAEIDTCLIHLMGVIATSFPVLHKSQHVQYVCKYMDALLRVSSTQMHSESVTIQDHVHRKMCENGYLNTSASRLARNTDTPVEPTSAPQTVLCVWQQTT